MRENVLKIGRNKIKEVGSTLKNAGISGKILYVSDPHVDMLYGNLIRPQIEGIGLLKEETVSRNTIRYAMNVAERVIATDIDCICCNGWWKNSGCGEICGICCEKNINYDSIYVCRICTYVALPPYSGAVHTVYYFCRNTG